jgi:hypothetical protein
MKVIAMNKKWHAVSIVPKGICCELVKSLRSSRFLSAEAPRLPLQECTMPSSCTCAYRHYEDRRGRARRADELRGIPRSRWTAEERRSKADRRLSD